MRRLREVIRLKRPELRAKTTLDFCITNISPKIWRIWFCNYGIRLIWLRVNNGYSQNKEATSGNAFESVGKIKKNADDLTERDYW